MKKNRKRVLCMILAAGFLMAGCSSFDDNNTSSSSSANTPTTNASSSVPTEFIPELEVSFGRDGEPFTMNLYDNDTARAISRYHYDDYENYEVMQYYDIPDRYEIPSNPETITSEKAGEVYYSAPNRIVLFYKDATVTGEYTKLGTFDATQEFVSAVENNPVVEGWSNKIVSIRPVN